MPRLSWGSMWFLRSVLLGPCDDSPSATLLPLNLREPLFVRVSLAASFTC